MRVSFARASGPLDDPRWACFQGSTTDRMLGCVLKSAAQKGALGLALARFGQRIQEAAQEPTLARCGRRCGSALGESGRARWELGEGREGGRHGGLLRRWAHLSQALPACWSYLLAKVALMLRCSK